MKIINVDKIIKKLDVFGNISRRLAEEKSLELLEKVHTTAMANLESSLGTGLTGVRWGHSDQLSIEESKTITKDKDGYILTYTSPHARVVELGALETGTVLVESQSKYPIHMHGMLVGATTRFRIQPGYFYLDRAKQEHLDDISRDYNDVIKRAIHRSGL